MKPIIALLTILTTSSLCYGKGTIIFPLSKAAAKKYISTVENLSAKKLGFNPKTVKFKENNTEGSSLIVSNNDKIWVYDIDINNDGENEYLAIYVFGGRMNTSGIASVVDKKLKFINVDQVISKSLWNDPSGDLSKLHLWLAAPAVVKKNGDYIIRFLDKKPKLKFFEYLWKKQKFKLVRTTSSNQFS